VYRLGRDGACGRLGDRLVEYQPVPVPVAVPHRRPIKLHRRKRGVCARAALRLVHDHRRRWSSPEGIRRVPHSRTARTTVLWQRREQWEVRVGAVRPDVGMIERVTCGPRWCASVSRGGPCVYWGVIEFMCAASSFSARRRRRADVRDLVWMLLQSNT
jgi:hypothetical protein